MRRLIALSLALALVLPLSIGFAHTPARADGDTATNVALGLAAFAVFNQLFAPRIVPPPAPVVVPPAPVYRDVPAYREVHVYRDVPAYRPGHGYRKVYPSRPHEYRRVIPYPHGRYELRGDVHHGHRWVWVQRGHFAAPPVPPLPPPPYHR
jgi:hypothetical protein